MDTRTYLIRVVAEGRYAHTGDFYTLTVSKPFDNPITGGGCIINQNSGGSLAGDIGQRTDFSVNLRYNNRRPQGKVRMIIRRTEAHSILYAYMVKSTAITLMGTDRRAGTDMFEAKCSVVDITDPLNPISIAGKVTMQMCVTGRGEPGTSLRIRWASRDSCACQVAVGPPREG